VADELQEKKHCWSIQSRNATSWTVSHKDIQVDTGTGELLFISDMLRGNVSMLLDFKRPNAARIPYGLCVSMFAGSKKRKSGQTSMACLHNETIQFE
jgi:hypothetical protein